MRNSSRLGVLLGLLLFSWEPSGLAVQPYTVSTEISIEDRWRWTELEGLSGLGLRYAAEGLDGDIWFARKEGVVRYDGLDVAFFDVSGCEDAESVIDIHVSRSGLVYLLLDRYLAIWQDGEWSVEPVAASSKSYGNAICENKDGEVWIGIGRGAYRCRGRTIEFFDLGYGEVCAAVIDEQNKLWLADAQLGQIEVFETEETSGSSLKKLYSFADQFERAAWAKLLLNSDGDVWVIAYNWEGPWYRYENYERRVASENMGSGAFNWYSMGIAEVPRKRIWLSTGRRLGELYDGELSTYDVEDYPIPTSYTYLLPLRGDRLLIGGKASKIYVVDLSDDRWVSYPRLNFQCEDKEGVFWFLEHDGGVVSHDLESSEWGVFDSSDGLIDRPNRVLCGSDGTLWVSGSHEGEAAVSFREGEKWIRKSFPRAGTTFSHLASLEASDGSVLFGSGAELSNQEGDLGGAVVFRKEEGRFNGARVAPPLFPRRTANLVEREGDGLWFGGNSLLRQVNGGIMAPERIPLFGTGLIPRRLRRVRLDGWLCA